MRNGYNPVRRNRNIGTAKQGHGQDNRLVIPNPGRLLTTLDHIGEYRIERRAVADTEIQFIVEELRHDCVHPCSISDVVRMFEAIPASDWAGIKIVVFRQPTRKQNVLNPAWGRLSYSGDVVAARNRTIASGPMVLLDAVEHGLRLDWSVRLDADAQDELDRLRGDGHGVERVGNRYRIQVTAEAARETQLYRTVPHEIGHWFDWLSKVETPAARGDDYFSLTDRYFSRPKREREAFAHRYADRIGEALRLSGAIPFDRLD